MVVGKCHLYVSSLWKDSEKAPAVFICCQSQEGTEFLLHKWEIGHIIYISLEYSFSVKKLNVQMVLFCYIFNTFLSLCIQWKMEKREKWRVKKCMYAHERELFLKLKCVLFSPYQCAVLFQCSVHPVCNKLNSDISLVHHRISLPGVLKLKSQMRRNILFSYQGEL